ncbi:MAG: hypothetical protein LCH73_03425 [Proteobacteria bacterium]|nr:hypothetical protein [Pseudomonadota bacterium]
MTRHTHWPRTRRTLAALPLAALAACGSGGDDNPTEPPTAMTIQGFVAQSEALSGAAIEARCATGSGQATSNADGSYQLAVSDGAGPCLVRAATPDGGHVYGMAASGSSPQVQLNFVTTLIVAQMTATDPDTFWSAIQPAALSQEAAAAGSAAVLSLLADGGAPLTQVADPLNGAIQPHQGSSAGDSYGEYLYTLPTTLATAGTTQPALVSAVVTLAQASTPAGTSLVPSLPPALLLRAPASGCASLRTGSYRLVLAHDGTSTPATERIAVDAAAMTLVNERGDTMPLTDQGGCRFTANQDAGLSAELAVSAAGLVAVRWGTPVGFRAGVMLPEQTIALADLAGEWNNIAMDRTDADNTPHLTRVTITLDAGGLLTTLSHCDPINGSCLNMPGDGPVPSVVYTTNPAGGFDVTNTPDGWADRAFAYRAGGGELVAVGLSPSGHLSLATRKADVALPAVGAVIQGWDVADVFDPVTEWYTAPASMDFFQHSVTAVDVGADSYMRLNKQPSGAWRPEPILNNHPQSGYWHRLAGYATDSQGVTTPYVEYITLQLRGMGASVTGFLPTQQQLLISVYTPQ